MNNSTKVQLYPQNNFWGDDFLIFSHIWPFRCHDSQSNWEVITKIICLIEDNSINISETLLSKYLQWKAINAIFIFSHYKSMETLSCHSNESTWTTAIKTTFVVANVMNSSAKFQLYPLYGFWRDDFWIRCRKFSLSVVIATSQIKRIG